MSSRSKLIVKLLALVMIIPMVLSACAPAATPVAEKPAEPTAAATEAVAAPTSAAADAAAPTAKAAEPVTLVIWGDGVAIDPVETDPQGKGAYLIHLKESFEKDHPGVTLKFEKHGWDEELRQNLTNAMLAGTGPDVIVGEGFFKNYAQLDALLPIDISDIKDNLVMGVLQGATYKDQVYGISAYTSVFGFERNCEVIKKAGLDCENPPKTWDELLKQTQEITAKGAGEYYGYSLQGPAGFSLGAAFRNYVYLLENGAAMAKAGSDGMDFPAFNDAKAVPVYEFLRKLNAATPPGLTFEADEGKVYSQLFQGKSAYQMAGGWHVTWAKENKCADCRYSDVPLPEGGKPASVIVANVMYGALKTSKNPELAKEFVKYVAKDDVQALAFQASGRLPTTKSALTALRPNVDSNTQAYIDVLLNSSNLYAMPQWSKNTQKIWTAYGDFLTKLYTTDAPVQGLLDELQKTAEEAVK